MRPACSRTCPRTSALEVVLRMLRMEVVQNEILADVERTLRAEFMTNLARTNRRDNHEVMAEIFNYFDRGTEARFMAALEERNKEAADRIQALMFTFEDLASSTARGSRPCSGPRATIAWRWPSRAPASACASSS